ncbi:hypothetical protein ACGFNU_21055 [Spirillospora sp. NPDC048911]|uniref:hypothetical protein n=1 Tax=Spirillospora sp. NPDC048911 TaxID=3364527 RepID=UPI00371AC0A4
MNILRRLWHRITGRHTRRFVPGYVHHGHTYPAALVCDPCELHIAVALAPANPESLTRSLEPGEEDFLAELDAQLWPEAADTTWCRDVLDRMFFIPKEA